MKKIRLLICLLLLSFASLAQSRYFTKVEFQIGNLYNGGKLNTGTGGTIVSGYNFKGVSIAGGFSVIFFDQLQVREEKSGP